MINKKGFTLVEIIVSLAVLAILTVSFLTIITGNFIITNKTIDITKTAFEIQKSLEEKIDKVTGYLVGDEIPPEEDYRSGQMNIWSSLKSGGITVKYYEVEDANNNKVFATLVPNVKIDLLEPISLASINLQFNRSSRENLIYAYGNQSIEAVGNFENDEEFRYRHLTNVVEWYVSDSKFIMPIPNDDEVIGGIIEDIHEFVNYYPMFPRDYVIVKNERIDNFGASTSKITDLTPYIGKHLVYTATPGEKSGKIGKQSVSRSMFISGLPVMDNLAMHLDANFIDTYNSNGLGEVIKDGESFLISKWYNLFSIIGNSSPNEFFGQSNVAISPKLFKTESSDRFKGQFVRFEAGKSLSISKSISGNKQNVFVVARNRSSLDSTIISNNNYAINMAPSPDLSKWTLVETVVNSNNGNDFVIGDSNVDVAEIIFYNGELSQENKDKVRSYLRTKYGL